MKTHHIQFIWPLLLGFLALDPSLSTFAEGTAFTYQGQLREAGVPVNASANFVFGLWDASAAGSRIGAPVTLNAVAVSEGFFTVELDFGASGFDGSPRWLEITVNGTALAPRQAVTPVPLALYALTPAGPPGPVGATGPQGPPGATGTPGPQGPTGPQGARGTAGPTGPMGARGAQGAPGVAGATGPQGAQGPQGPAGLTGATGLEGVRWRGVWNAGTAYAIDDAVSHNGSSWMVKLANTGSAPMEGSANWELLAKKGDPGANGAMGATGAPGPAGPIGATGAQGSTGATGPPGPSGPQGIQGGAGPPGLAGATGPAGPEGLKWRGAWSSSTGYAIDDAVSHNGSSWMAKAGSTGSAPADGSANWDLLGKKGDTGANGAVGAQGPQGPAGITGATGAQGPAGPTGVTGAQGLPGVTGATGPQGPQGTPGPAGPQGPPGAFNRTGTNATFSGGNVGIGTTNPQAEFHVRTAGDGIRIQGAAGGDVNEAYLSFMDNPGSRIGYVGDGSTGDQSVFLNADIGDVVLNTAAGRVLTATSGGNVGIGTTSPASKLEVVGNARVNGRLGINEPESFASTLVIRAFNFGNRVIHLLDSPGGTVMEVYASPNELIMSGSASKTSGGTSWRVVSDRRLKQDVRPYEPGLNEVLQLRPVRFRYRDDAERGLTSDLEEVGFIAQEIREVIPDAVTEGKDGYLSLKADPIHWAAINAIQMLNAKLESETAALRADVLAQGAEIHNLKRQFAELQALVSGPR